MGGHRDSCRSAENTTPIAREGDTDRGTTVSNGTETDAAFHDGARERENKRKGV